MNDTNVEIGAVSAATGKFRIYNKEELGAIIASLNPKKQDI